MPVMRSPLFATLGVLAFLLPARADLTPAWIQKLPVGTALGAGLAGTVVSADGVIYVTGASGGPSGITDVVTAAFAADGTPLWTRTFDGPAGGSDQGSGVALGPLGVVWVCGSTAGPGNFANVLALCYDGASGALLATIQYSSGPGKSEHGAWIAPDDSGNVYIGGGTVGDGPDGLLLKFDGSGQLAWQRTWDGPASAPFSSDSVQQLALAPDGAPVLLIRGVMHSQHPDYVLVKYAPANGATIWERTWGVAGDDSPVEMAFDGAGDVYVTGIGLDFVDKYSTIKVDGDSGALVWQAYDLTGFHCRASGIAVDAQGGVYVTGSFDPDGDESNQNDNFFTVKRSAADGTFRWSHTYGSNCAHLCLDLALDVAVDPAGNVLVGGSSSSPPYNGDSLVLVLDADSGLEITRGSIDGGLAHLVNTVALRFDGLFGVRGSGRDYDANTGLIQVMVYAYPALLGTLPGTYCTAKTSSCGSIPSLGAPHAVASTSGGPGTFDVTCGPVPAAPSTGILIYTTHGAQAPPLQLAMGYLCIQTGPGFFRVLMPALPVGAGCSAAYTFDFGAYLATQQVDPALVPGAEVDMQAWYRDPPSPGAANLSNALLFWIGP